MWRKQLSPTVSDLGGGVGYAGQHGVGAVEKSAGSQLAHSPTGLSTDARAEDGAEDGAATGSRNNQRIGPIAGRSSSSKPRKSRRDPPQGKGPDQG
jgi:hypothetical protein